MPCQQDRLYLAERALDEGYVFDSLHEAQVFVDGLRETWWWESWCDSVLRVEVGPARQGADFLGVGWYEPHKNSGRMEFSTCRPSLKLIVHELAHVLASAKRHSQSHDPWFVRIYVELVYLIMGSEAYETLGMSLIAHGVDFDASGLTEWVRDQK